MPSFSPKFFSPKLAAVVAVAALAAVALAPSPSEAFTLRFGPFHIGIPFFYFGHHRHHHIARSSETHTASLGDEAEPNSAKPAPNPTNPVQIQTAALLDPGLALPTVYGDIFWPASSPTSTPWPFGYEAIFQTAFAKPHSDQDASACQRPADANAVVGRIKAEVRPTGAQNEQLQKLGVALGMAAQYLASACPKDVPPQPTARLQLMEWQIEKLAQALDIVRPPLADFQQSLSDDQRARFNAMAPAAATRANTAGNMMPACAASPTAIDWSVEQISLSVQPTEAQHDAMAAIKDAFHNAAGELDAHCPASPAPDALARLEATQARLDATWRSLVAIQSALANFENGLSDQQRARLNATDFAAAE
jgi:hypothetical protein